MEKEKKKAPGWLYVPLIALLVLVAYRPLKQIGLADDTATAKTLATVPSESFKQLFDEHAAMLIEAHANENPHGDPMALPRFTARRSAWDAKVRKYLLQNEWSQDSGILQRMLASNSIMSVHARYQESFGATRLMEATRQFEKDHPLNRKEVPADYSSAWSATWEIYLPAVFISMCGLLLFAQRNGMKLTYELPRLVILSLVPVASFFLYLKIDRTRQVRSALEFACGLLMFVFSLGTAAGSLARAQTGPFGGKSRNEETKKKRKYSTVTFSTGVSSELPGPMVGIIFNPAPNLQTTLKVALDNGFYASAGEFKGLDHADPDANLGDWVVASAGYSRTLGGTSITVEGMHMDPAPLSMIRGDFSIARATVARTLGKNGKFGTLLGTVRSLWKFNKGATDRGTYGYLGYNRNFAVPKIPAAIATSTELRFDPGNLGRGSSVGFAERIESPIVLPGAKRWTLRPFIGLQGPIIKERPVRTDNRSWELFGGFSLAFSMRI